MLLLTGLPVAGTVIILVFGCLCRKTNSRGREDTRSGTEKQCSHDLFHTPLGSDMSSVYISAVVWSEPTAKYFVLYCLLPPPSHPSIKQLSRQNFLLENL